MKHSKITAKGQITLPADMRRALDLNIGDQITFEPQPDGSLLLKKKRGSIADLSGLLKYDGPPVSIEDMNEGIRRAAENRYGKAFS